MGNPRTGIKDRNQQSFYIPRTINRSRNYSEARNSLDSSTKSLVPKYQSGEVVNSKPNVIDKASNRFSLLNTLLNNVNFALTVANLNAINQLKESIQNSLNEGEVVTVTIEFSLGKAKEVSRTNGNVRVLSSSNTSNRVTVVIAAPSVRLPRPNNSRTSRNRSRSRSSRGSGENAREEMRIPDYEPTKPDIPDRPKPDPEPNWPEPRMPELG